MLPEGWRQVTLGEIAHIASGGTPDRSEPRYWGGDIPWVTTGEIQFNTITDTAEKITADGLRNSSAKLFPPGTLLMAMYGQGKTRGQVAKLGIEAATNQACAAIQVRGDCDPEFVFQFLAANYQAIRELGNAGTQQNLNAGLIKGINLLLPSRREQSMIGVIAHAWDVAIATAEKMLANSRQQKTALGQQLLLGRARRSGFASAEGDSVRGFGMFPKDWQPVCIGDVAVELSVRNDPDERLPVLSCTKHQGLVDSLGYFTKRVFSENTSTYKIVPRGAFAYATNHIDEGSIGYQDLYDRALISPMYTVFRAHDRLDPGFLFKLLKTEHYRQVFAANTNASVDRRGSLRWSDFKKIEIPVPSLAEQRAIAEVIDAAEEEARKLASQIEALRAEKRALMSDLLLGRRRAIADKVVVTL